MKKLVMSKLAKTGPKLYKIRLKSSKCFIWPLKYPMFAQIENFYDQKPLADLEELFSASFRVGDMLIGLKLAKTDPKLFKNRLKYSKCFIRPLTRPMFTLIEY